MQLDEKILLTNGDSWTFGSEIMSPEFLAGPGEKGTGMGNRFKEGHKDTDASNDHYRIPRIWPTQLAEKLGHRNVNLAWPARSNDGICESTMSFIIREYIVPRRPTSGLLVVVGWSSPERKDMVISSQGKTYLQTIWPAMDDTSYYADDAVRKYFRYHVNHLWVEQEYVARFIDTNYHLANFLENHGIRYFFFNAFYQTPNRDPKKWESFNVESTIKGWKDHHLDGWHDPMVNWHEKIERLSNQWKLISPTRFILKDVGSFKEYIDRNVDAKERMINWHPSPESHSAWADFLHKYITNSEQKAPQRFTHLIK